LCHNAWADLLRKQQVRSSNLRVGSNAFYVQNRWFRLRISRPATATTLKTC
jgi:hypothetical protein